MIPPIDFTIQINSEEELDKYIELYNLKKYVNYKADISQFIKEHPVLNYAFYYVPYGNIGRMLTGSSIKMNELLKADIVPEKAKLSSLLVNWFLTNYYNLQSDKESI